MSTTPSTPTTVEPGQIWRDNDQRTKGSGEFVVLAVVRHTGVIDWGTRRWADDEFLRAEAVARRGLTSGCVADMPFAVVQRGSRLSRISCHRLLKGTNTQRGYTYLGMQR